jgi:hypothetical protein
LFTGGIVESLPYRDRAVQGLRLAAGRIGLEQYWLFFNGARLGDGPAAFFGDEAIATVGLAWGAAAHP